MSHRRSILFAFISLLFALLACYACAGGYVEPPLELPPPAISAEDGTAQVATPSGLAPTATLPGDTGGTVPANSGDATVKILVDLNLRKGPGVQYDRVGFLLANETVPILGQDPATGWWKVACPARINEVTECWISGGAQYSQASDTGSVPVAVVPPTPTPEPTVTPVPEERDATVGDAGTAVISPNALLAYSDSSGVWLTTLDMAQNPPTALSTVKVADAAGVGSVLLSPSGQKVAYLTGESGSNTLHVVNSDGSDNHVLVQSETLTSLRGIDSGELALLIGQVQWLTGSQTLAFNSTVINLIGPGTGSQEDLWTVTVGGELVERIVAQNGGGAFDISATGRFIAGGSEGIVRGNMDGTGLETIIPFELVNTASEYIYYPQPIWTADGSRAYVSIPSREQFSDTATFALWEIPNAGPATKLTEYSGNTLFGSVRWTERGNRLTAVSSAIGGGAFPELTVATGNGGSPVVYATDPQLTFWEWRPDGNGFLYSGSDFYAAGQIDAAPVQFVIPGQTAVMRWLNSAHFIVVTGSSGAWNINSSNLAGVSASLTSSNAQFPSIDVWIP